MSNKYNNVFVKAYSAVVDALGSITWKGLKKHLNKTGKYYKLTEEDLDEIQKILAGGHYIILNRREYCLSTYLIMFANFVKTRKFGWYDHVLFNIEHGSPTDREGFILEEATGSGVHYSRFMEVFNCDSVAILKPRNMLQEDWDKVVSEASTEIGVPYDDIFDLNDASHMSCAELVREGLRAIPDYAEKFPNLEAGIKDIGNLTPQMFYDCADFELVWEKRR